MDAPVCTIPSTADFFQCTPLESRSAAVIIHARGHIERKRHEEDSHCRVSRTSGQGAGTRGDVKGSACRHAGLRRLHPHRHLLRGGCRHLRVVRGVAVVRALRQIPAVADGDRARRSARYAARGRFAELPRQEARAEGCLTLPDERLPVSGTSGPAVTFRGSGAGPVDRRLLLCHDAPGACAQESGCERASVIHKNKGPIPMKPMNLIALLVLVLPTPNQAMASGSGCTIDGLAGLYETAYGQMRCEAKGEELQCCYGNIRACDTKVILSLSSGGKSLDGKWLYPNGTNGAARF